MSAHTQAESVPQGSRTLDVPPLDNGGVERFMTELKTLLRRLELEASELRSSRLRVRQDLKGLPTV